MASGTKVQDVRGGVQLLSAIFEQLDTVEYLNSKGVTTFADDNGFDAKTKKALQLVVTYAQNKYDVDTLSLRQVNRALGDAMRAIAKGAKTGSGRTDILSPSEKAGLAKTWRAVAAFAAANKNKSIEDFVVNDPS